MFSVLIPHSPSANFYVLELGRAYQALGCTVVYGHENLIQNNFVPDLVHLQWPEEHYRWINSGSITDRISGFIYGLSVLKNKGAKIAWTIHNLEPHDFLDSDVDLQVYEKITEISDLLVHHCHQSIELFNKKYPFAYGKPFIVTPMANFFGYLNNVTRESAREKLGIASSDFVYLSFGNIRGYKGLDDLFLAFDAVNVKGKKLVIAGAYSEISKKGSFRDRLMLAFRKRFSGNIDLHFRHIPSDEVQIFFNSADCLVLTHARGLNSGVAILGMSFGKPVVGPRIGCIEWVLEQGKNVTFDVGDKAGLIKAMEEVFINRGSQDSCNNMNVVKEWSWEKMAASVLAAL
jgi:beta-1,4-mannosyltransferase